MKRTLKYILEKQLFMKKKEIDNVVITLCKGCLLENRKKLNAVLTNNRPLIGSLDILENVYFDMHGNPLEISWLNNSVLQNQLKRK